MGQKKNEIDEIETLFATYLQSVRKYVARNATDRSKLEAFALLLEKQKDSVILANDCTHEYVDALHNVEIQLANLKGNLLKAVAEAEPKEQTLEFEFPITH